MGSSPLAANSGSGPIAVRHPHDDLVGERGSHARREAVDETAEEWSPEPDRGRLRRNAGELGRDLDRPFDVADLVDEAELQRPRAQPDLTGCELPDPILAELPPRCDPAHERRIERVDEFLLLGRLDLGLVAPW